MNWFAYAGSNPIVLLDPAGLATFRGFPADKQQQMEEAVERAKERLQKEPCCAGSAGPRLLGLLDQVTFVYQKDLHAKDGPLCGEVSNFLTKKVKIGEAAFNFALCCRLESTLTHEVNHLRSPAKGSGEEASRRLEKSCFECPGGSTAR